MIVRILGMGQFRVPDEAGADLNAIDDRVQAAADGQDEDAFQAALSELVAMVHRRGEPLPPQELVGSDAVLPGPDTTLEDALALLSPDGLIPD